MNRYHENFYEDDTVSLDGGEWIGCSFKNCVFEIETGNFIFKNNTYENCSISVKGNASNIVSIIELIYPGKLPFDGEPPKPHGKPIF